LIDANTGWGVVLDRNIKNEGFEVVQWAAVKSKVGLTITPVQKSLITTMLTEREFPQFFPAIQVDQSISDMPTELSVL
jgi:hypothetical protein